MIFDAYRASVPASPAHIEAILNKGLSGRTCYAKSPHKNYSQAISIFSAGETARVSWGGSNPLPFIDVQGPLSDRLAGVLRAEYPTHTCGRADACVDFVGGREGFEEVSQKLVGLAQKHGVSTRLIASPSDPESGRTLYVGSRSSEVMVRLYEKGRQLIESGEEGDADHVRFELEVKPSKRERKLILARTPAEEIAGFARWSGKAQELVTSTVVPFKPRGTDRKTPAEQALEHMIHQYQNTATQLVREQGRRALLRMLATLYTTARDDARNGEG